MAAVDFFEATEKLLEIWFEKPDRDGGSLRSITRDQWKTLLDRVNCQIIGEQHAEAMDSYILSESSMFVTDRRFILKTCGTTTLLDALDAFLRLASAACNLTTIADVFYSRKNFMEPRLQKGPHRSFDSETALLDSFFAPDGAAYALGRLNGDAWYLYTLDRASDARALPASPDQTLEILMTGLDGQVARLFYKSPAHRDDNHVTDVVGLSALFPDAVTEAAMFDPCGYSMNGIRENDDVYYTVHVTPQPSCSYASFETNVPAENYTKLIGDVVDVFKPEKVLVTLFANSSALCGVSINAFDGGGMPGYRRKDRQFYEFVNQYNLTLATFIKEGS
ncbi:S-adenosylmethionine decarboxylase proenzyme-like isoform X2 [Oscarella lobularis]|uniref:S-adenosylmethionine decarboxylase proenzyme-like isoform X2 n=1 Tax=Oscarella lobularis TaxID=121494 RepID=UPI0033134E4D